MFPFVPFNWGMPKKRAWPQSITAGSVVVKVYEVSHPTNASGKAYVVSYNTPFGRKTVKFAQPEAALDEARLQAGKLAAGKVEAADMTGGEREELAAAREITAAVPLLSALREWHDARALCGGNLLTAVRFYAEHFKSTERKTILVKDAVTAFLKSKKAEGIDVKSSYEKVLPRLRDGILGDLPLDSLGKEQLTDWINLAFVVGDKKDVHHETFNTARRRMVTMWKWGRDEGYLPKLAKTAAEEIKTRKDTDHAPIGIMTLTGWKQALTLVHKVAPDLLATLVIGGFCGLRRSELAKQKWTDIDLVRGHLRVTKAKPRTPARRLVPIAPAARKWLRLCAQEGELIGPSWGSDHVRARVKAAGISCPKNAFRHSFISYKCAESGSVDRTAQDAGNSPKIVFQHYRELVTPRDGKAWFAVSPPT